MPNFTMMATVGSISNMTSPLILIGGYNQYPYPTQYFCLYFFCKVLKHQNCFFANGVGELPPLLSVVNKKRTKYERGSAVGELNNVKKGAKI